MESRPLPKITKYNEPFFKVERDELKLQRCTGCGNLIYFPRVACNQCLNAELKWEKVSPLGTIYSYSKVYRPQHEYFFKDVPLVLIAVKLDEGPLVISNLINYQPEDIKIGTRVKARREPVEKTDIKLLYFEPTK